LLGTLATPILGGVIPMLMLLAARRRGEYATAVAPRLLAHPITVVLVAGLYSAGILFQGWVISTDPLMRYGTLVATVIVVAISILALRAGAFRRRAVLELRGEEAGRVRYALVDAGDPAPVLQSSSGVSATKSDHGVGWLERTDLASGATLQLDVRSNEALLVWAHRVTDDGDSLPLQLDVSITAAGERRQLGLTGGRETVPPVAGPRILDVRRLDSGAPSGRVGPGIEGWAALASRPATSDASA
jgi:hypothetical protein